MVDEQIIGRAWPALTAPQVEALTQLLLHGNQSRIKLAEALKLSRPTMTRVSKQLLELGLIKEVPQPAIKSRGRPEEILSFLPDAAHFIGVKLTSNRIYAVLTDLSARIINEFTLPILDPGPQAVVEQIVRACQRLCNGQYQMTALGIGLAADVVTVSGSQIVKYESFLGWQEVPLEEMLREHIGAPIVIANDVQSLTSGYHWFGALHYNSLVVISCGAGIGSGLVVNGQLVPGVTGRSGRIGHLRIGGSGKPCEKGHVDCVHGFVTTAAIEHNCGLAPGSYEQAVERAYGGDAQAQEAFERAAFALGAVIGQSINTIDPECVAVTGEGLDMLDFAPEAMKQGLSEFTERQAGATTRIERPGFSFDMYSRGAAVMALRHLLRSTVEPVAL